MGFEPLSITHFKFKERDPKPADMNEMSGRDVVTFIDIIRELASKRTALAGMMARNRDAQREKKYSPEEIQTAEKELLGVYLSFAKPKAAKAMLDEDKDIIKTVLTLHFAADRQFSDLTKAGEISKNGKTYTITPPFTGVKSGSRQIRAAGIADQIKKQFNLQEVFASSGIVSIVSPKGELKAILDGAIEKQQVQR